MDCSVQSSTAKRCNLEADPPVPFLVPQTLRSLDLIVVINIIAKENEKKTNQNSVRSTRVPLPTRSGSRKARCGIQSFMSSGKNLE